MASQIDANYFSATKWKSYNGALEDAWHILQLSRASISFYFILINCVTSLANILHGKCEIWHSSRVFIEGD